MIAYLDRLREIGASERMVQGERDGWILMAARWPDRVREWMPGQARAARRPADRPALPGPVGDLRQRRRTTTRVLVEAADIMAGLAEQAVRRRRDLPRTMWRSDDLPFDLLDGLAVEADPRAARLLDLMRERGWDGLARLGAAARDAGRALRGCAGRSPAAASRASPRSSAPRPPRPARRAPARSGRRAGCRRPPRRSCRPAGPAGPRPGSRR